MKYKIPFIKPSFPDSKDVKVDYESILAANWYTNFGIFERRFSEMIGKYIGTEYHAATFSNATNALMASIVAVLGRGDGSRYIIMPSFTFTAGAEAVIWGGYKPLFIDIEELNLQMSINEAQSAIAKHKNKIACILFCNTFGIGATNIDQWESLSLHTNKPMIVDSAAGFGSYYYKKRKVGTAGICEIFSFHATKPFSIGEGGAVVSKDKILIQNLMMIQNFGFDESKTTTRLGFNAKLQEINAAIGIRQFKQFDNRLKQRRQVLMKYMADLDKRKYRFQENANHGSLCFAAVVVKDPHSRNMLIERLRKVGVEAKTYYSPSLHKHIYYQQFIRHSKLNTTSRIDDAILSLPIHDNMPPKDINLIIETLNQ